MAEYNINHNISEGKGSRGAAGGNAKPINEDKLASKIGKIYEKVAKDTNASLQKNLSKDLDRVLNKVVREIVRHQTGGTSTGGTGQDIGRIIKEATKNISVEAGNSLLKELQKIKPGQAGNSRELETLFKTLDRRIAGLAPAINTALSKAGVELNPQGLKIIANTISASLRGVVSKEFGSAMRDFNRTVESLSRGLDAAVKAFDSLSKIKKSGGGIDVKESVQAIKSVGTFAKEFKNVSDDFKSLSQSVKTLAKDQKAIMKDVSDTLSEMKRSITEKARSITKAPPVILDASNWEAAANDFLNRYEKISKSLSQELPGGGKRSPQAPKEIKQLDTTMKNVGKEVGTLTKQVEKMYTGTKNVTTTKGSEPVVRKLGELVKEVSTLIGKVENMLPQKRIEIAKDVKSGKLDVSVLEEFGKEAKEFTKAVKSGMPSQIKEAAGRGIIGIDPNFTNQIRKATNIAEKAIVASSKEDRDKAFMEGLKKSIKSGVTEAIEAATEKPKVDTPTKTITQQASDLGPLIKNIEQLNSRLRGPQSINVYPEKAIPATKGGFDPQFEQTPTKGQLNQYKLVRDRIKDLSSSLVDLQDYMVTTMETEFKAAGGRWAVVREGTEKSIQEFFTLVKGSNSKSAGKQYAFEIADIESIKRKLFTKGRGAATKGTAASIVKEITDVLSTELAANLPSNAAGIERIASWLKTTTEEQIKGIEAIETISDKLVTIKNTDIKGVLPSEDLKKKLTKLLVDDRNTLEKVFKVTVGQAEAKKSLREDKLVRTVSLPAARLTKSGTPVFETSKGSQRALQKFATFKTGYENLYEQLAKDQALSYSKGFAEKIKQVGIRPVGLNLDFANKLAEDMLKDFASVNLKNFEDFRKSVGRATGVKADKLTGANREKLAAGAKEALSVNLGEALQPGDLSKASEDLINVMKRAGLSAHEVVKSMDTLDFQNVYDVMLRVLKGTEGKIEPLKTLAKNPRFDKGIREVEGATRQVEQALPLVEPGRPRRGFQQGNVLNLLTRASNVYAGEKPTDLKPADQLKYIKDLNVRMNELVKEATITNDLLKSEGKRTLQDEGIRTVSSLGLPEAVASKVDFYRPGNTEPGTKFLSALNAVSTKMNTDILPELAPFGVQFNNLGKNISGVTMAMESSKKELDRLAKEYGASTLEGYGTEFPGLRSGRESELISAGRLGDKGFGFNVLTELRHTAGTMEDQILVSGKLANALTAATKTLIKPAPAGRIGGSVEGSVGVGEVQTGVIKDKDIQNVLDSMQEVLGVPDRYKGRADQAFIDEVKRAITVVRGEKIEVQQARLTEVFLNAFGRKLTTRYGSKGVSVTPGALPEESQSEALDIIQRFPKAKVKVLTEEERKKAGLGVALLPRSMGELLSEVLDKYKGKLESEGFDVGAVKSMLIASGNKFVFELFKDASKGLVIEDEAITNRKTFGKAADVFKSITGRGLPGDKSAIQDIRNLFKKEVGGGVFKERAIDVRISSTGIAKRGLQPEVLESVVGNIASVGERGSTTVATRLGEPDYKSLLGEKTKAGELSKLSASLGYETVGSKEQINELAKSLGISKVGEKDPFKDVIAQRARELEERSSFYTTVIDELGEQRKSIVGEKFLSIIEETGQTEAWSPNDIRRGIKGASVDIPVLSAYSNVFGENSALLSEIVDTTNANQRKQLEFLKALQFQADETGTLQSRQLEYLDRVNLNAVKYFDASTGVLAEGADDLDPRNLEGTLFDTKKFAKPFLLDIPKAGGKPGEKEPFYVPGALARGTYSEDVVAGEKGIEDVGRRIQHVVNMARRANELLDRPATLQAEINKLEMELSDLISKDDPAAAQTKAILSSRKDVQKRLLSGEGEISTTVKKRVTETVAEYLRESQQLKHKTTPESTTRLNDILTTVKNALSNSEAPAEAFQIKRFAPGQVKLAPGSSEIANVEAYLERQKKTAKTENFALADAIGKASDLIIGKGPSAQDAYNTVLKGIAEIKRGELQNIETFRDVLKKDYKFAAEANKTSDSGTILKLLEEKKRLAGAEMEATESKMHRLAKDISSGQGLELAGRLGIDIDKELQFKYEKALDSLQKAKIDYFHALAQKAVGKEGAIGTAVFSRKFPAVMKKATVAIVDRTSELAKFKENIKTLQQNLPDNAQSALSNVISEVDKLSVSHTKKIDLQKKGGFPILKQHELGIPTGTAKKLPVDFKTSFDFNKAGDLSNVRKSFKNIDGTLFDYLKYIENLEEVVTTTDDDQLKKLASKELKDVGGQGAVEAIRYPFTGPSSIVPYQAKLLEGEQDRKARNTFIVPGAPEFNIGEFNTNIKEPVEGIIEGLHEQRENIFKAADASGGPITAEQSEEVKRLTGLMDSLAKAVFDVTPRYAAHTAKLDFDGDAIAVHTAETEKARREIGEHYKTVAQFSGGLQEVYRDFFTADTLKSLSPTGDSILAEMQETFIKKVGEGQGFDFLIKPFLTGQAAIGEKETPTLEYADRSEKLSILGLGNKDIRSSLEQTFQDIFTGIEVPADVKTSISKAIENVASPFTSLEEETNSLKQKGGIEKRLTFAEDLFKALEKVDDDLSTSYAKEIEQAITGRVFESKFQSAVEAQLAKVQAGIQTEGLYRVGRVFESNLGFGKGFAGTGEVGDTKPSDAFLKRNPVLGITGGSQQALIEDQHAKFGETFRFAFQQGQDVKKGGSTSVATELVGNLSRGAQGVKDLWTLITDESEKDYAQLRDFSEVIAKTTKQRLGKMPTNDIRKELIALYEARGEDYSPGELATADRKTIVEKVVDATGLKSFLKEASIQIQEAAVEGIVKQVSQYSPERRGRIGDPLSFARGKVKEEIAEGGINIREHITVPQLPLYAIRSEKGLKSQKKRFKERYGEPSIPDNLKLLRKDPKEAEEILEKYKEAKATARNVSDAFNDAVKNADRGAYGKLVRSTLDNINRDQKEIEDKFRALKSEGFYPRDQLSPNYLDNLVKRVSSMEGIPQLTKDILKRNPTEQIQELERLADLSGVPSLGKEERQDVITKVLSDFRQNYEKVLAQDPSLTLSEINEMAEEYAAKTADAAAVVYEMDRTLAVLATRAKEGITLASILPTTGEIGGAPSSTGPDKSYDFGDEAQAVLERGQAKRKAFREHYGPDKGSGSIGGGGIGNIIGGGFPMTAGSGVVPVHINSIAEGIGIMFGGGAATSGGRITEQLNPELRMQDQALKDIAETRKPFDQHGEDKLREIQAKLKKEYKNVEAGFDRHSGRFDDDNFQELIKKHFPGADPRDYEELKRKFFTTTLKTFSGSKFHAGGKDVGDVLKDFKYPSQGHRRRGQLEAISEGILDVDKGDYVPGGGKPKLDVQTQAAFDIGSALHAKLQSKIEKDMAAIGKEVDIERFITLKPQQFVKDIEGPITGFIDVAYKDASGAIEKISDIKTTGETFAKFETLSKAVGPEGTIELSKILNKEIPGHIRQKLEEYRTQLNVYLGALIQQAEEEKINPPENREALRLAPNLQAQLDFIPSEDTDLKTPPVSVTFKFDENRLREDLETLQQAREIVTKYVHNLDDEIADIPEEYREIVANLRKKVSGKTPGASIARTLESFQFENELDDIIGVQKQSDEFIDKYVKQAKDIFDFTQGKQNVYKEVEGLYGQAAKNLHDPPDIDPSRYETVGLSPEERSRQKTKVKSFGPSEGGEKFTEPLKVQFEAIQDLHSSSLAVLSDLGTLDFSSDIEKMHADIQKVLVRGKKPPSGSEFSKRLEQLTEGGFISFQESMKAWQLWRIAVGDFLINQAIEAEQTFDLAKDQGLATEEFSSFKKRVTDIRDFIVKSLGKRTDIYTKDRRFLLPNKAEDAGVYASPAQLFEQSSQPFENDEFTRGVYKDFLDNLDAGTLGAPADEIRKIAEQLANLDTEAQRVLESTELFARKGDEATMSWDFDTMTKRARNFREALSQYNRLNLSEEGADVEKKFQVRSLLQYLKQIEQVYGRLNLDKLQSGPYGRLETGAVKVPSFLPPGQQEALNRRNLQKFREFGKRPAGPGEGAGGPEIGESFSLFQKVTDQAGNVLKSTRTDFQKYGEVMDENDQKVGKFTESQVDLIDKMQMSGGTFRSAARRVIMWGAAASLVYGGVAALKDSLGELADIEVGIAQLRMVMNPLDTDFDSLTKSAVGFAKDYGVGVTEVLRSMKVFAQQGLRQAEVIDRTRVSTLASNVSTLSAGDATEALTAAMKVFGNEIGSADMALDAWSETEARHAITAADMANAIKKSAAAAKNAGFTFNELNGIVAGIGAVTRQSGKEVGTAMRFIARRLFSEKGPVSLGEIGIPTVTGEGENRRGFDVLSDLSMKWDELTNAQKLNIAQALGGTRQYNSLLVAMDNWSEVLEAVEDSTNSKGSAERRNVEIMKTYAKQLEQTKAAATELKLELGGFILPIFKGGLQGLKLLFEFMSAIPGPVKAASVALGLFFTYASKGLGIFDTISDQFGKGKGAVSDFIREVKDQLGTANFEIFGKGGGSSGAGIEGLKTFAKGAPDTLKAASLDDLHSGFGKLAFVIKSAGDQYNEFLSDVGSSSGDFGKGIEEFGKKFKNTAGIIDTSTDIFQLLGLSTGPFISAGTQIVESLAKGTGYAIEKSGKLFGKSGEQVAKFLSDTDPGLFKSIAPLAITIGTIGLALKGTASALDRTRKSAQQYAQSVYNTRRIEEDQIKELTNVTRQYDKLQKRLEKINKVINTPGLKETQQGSDNYTSPLLALADIQKDATKFANDLAKTNSKLVIGYDAQGDAILRLTGSYKTYVESLQRASSLELAKTDIDVLKKFSESLTDTGFGETIKQTLKTALGEVPGVGGLLEGLVSVGPGKEIQTITGQLNDLLTLREKYPLSDAFDQDISKLQDGLDKVKKIYDTTVTDFKRTLGGIFKFEGAQNLDRDTIARLLSDPGLTKGFELLVNVEPKIAEVNKSRLAAGIDNEVKASDVAGAEILKRIFPKKKAFIDYTTELTAAQLESSGIAARKGREVASGDIITFKPQLNRKRSALESFTPADVLQSALAEEFNIAGSQAIVELKKTTDGTYEAFATYINSKTLEVETRALDDPALLNLVDRIFPAGRVQTELENRLDALNTFVAGAQAGLVAIDTKKFKKDFDLGARFYSEVPTTTALQASEGFNIQTNDFGPLPQLQQTWARMTKDFFIEPMGKYNREVESLSKNTLDGLDDSAQLTKQKADELFDQQSILRNNQVVAQFAAVFADLSKSMEESSRVLKENLAVESARQESVRVTTGLLKGLPEGFDAIDTGVRKISDLSAKQLIAISSPRYRELAGQARTQQVNRDSAISQLEALEKTRIAIETIVATQGGLGSIVGPDAGAKSVEGFIEKATALQDIGMATLSNDINKLDTTSRAGFGDVVDRLETMIANQGDFTNYAGEIDKIAEQAAGPLTDQGAEMLAGKIAQQMGGLAGIRESATGRGDQRSAGTASAYIDRLTDILVQLRGVSKGSEDVEKFGKVGSGPLSYLPPISKYKISSEEFQQRAFRKLQPNELIERFKDEGKPGAAKSSLFDPREILKAISPEYRGKFEGSSEYKDLLSVQEDSKKLQDKSFLDAKTILKGSVAITTFEAFNKKHSSKVLDNLNDQLSTQETKLADVKTAGGEDPELEKTVASLKHAVAEQEKSLQFHSLISAMTKITGTTTALAKAFGVSETNLKRMNISALGLYVAMKAATKVTGKDMPESAKEFGKTVKDAFTEFKETGDLGLGTAQSLKNAGKKFEETYGDRVKEATGKTKEAIDAEIKTRLAGMKDLSQVEIEERASQIRKQASSDGAPGIKALIAALSAATIAGTVYEVTGRGTANADRERLAERQADIFNRIVEKYPEAADTIAQELIDQVKKQSAASPVIDTTPQNQLLEVMGEAEKANQFLSESIDKTKTTINEASESFSKLADEMAKFEMISELNKSTRDFIRTLADAATEFEVQRKYGGAAVLNENLQGFAGDAELPLQRRQMSTQQRLYASMGDDFQEAVTSYSYGLQTINTLVGRLGEATKRRREFIENNIEDPDVWKSLDDEIEATKDSIEDVTDTVREFGGVMSNISNYADAISKLNASLSDLAATQAVEALPGFKKYRDDMDKLLGGSNPDAIVGITPEQEREGRSVGVQLKQFESTKYDVERVRLLKQLQTSEGQARSKILQQLKDQPETRRREVETYNQRTEDGKLKAQTQLFEQALVEVQQLRQNREPTPTLFGFGPDKIDRELVEYQNSIVNMLQRASEKVSKEDLIKEVESVGNPITRLLGLAPLSRDQRNAEVKRIEQGSDTQYRGTVLTGRIDIQKQQREVFEELRRQLPTKEMSELKVAIAEPIVRELEMQTDILKLIAAEGLGDTGKIVSPFEAEEFISPLKFLLGSFVPRDTGRLDENLKNVVSILEKMATKSDNRSTGDKVLGAVKDNPGFKGLPSYSEPRFASTDRSDRPLANEGGYRAPAISEVPEWYQDYYKWISEKLGYKPEARKTGGGPLRGPGGSTGDGIPAMLSDGEYIVKTASAKKLGYGALEYMNKHGELPKFADGGGVSFRDALNMTGSGLFDIAGQLSSYADPLIEKAMKEQLSSQGFNIGAFAKHAGLSAADVVSTFAGGLVGALGLGVKGLGNIDKILTTAVKGQNLDTYSKFFDDAGSISGDISTAASDYVNDGGLKKSLESGSLFRDLSAASLDILTGMEAVKGGLKIGQIGSKAAIKRSAGKLFAPLKNQIGTAGEVDLDTLARLPESERIKWVMRQEGIDPSKTAEMTAATRRLVNDAKDPSKDVLKNIPKSSTAAAGEVSSNFLSLVKLADHEATKLSKLYPDLFARVKGGRAKFGDILERGADADATAGFLSPKDLASRLESNEPYEILLSAQKLKSGELDPKDIVTGLKHETSHGLEQFARDKLDKSALNKTKPESQFVKMRDFIQRFQDMGPVSDRAGLEFGEASYMSENFAEFGRQVMQGKKGRLADEFKELFDPKYFQTGTDFGAGGMAKRKHYAEGGIVGEWIKTAIDFYFGDDKEIDTEEAAKRAGSYLTNKKTKTNILDEAGKYGTGGMAKRRHYADGGPARRFTTINGELVEIDENGNIVKTLGKSEQTGFLKNKAYQTGVGEVLIREPNRSPQAQFAEETASETGRRFGEEATALHRAKNKISPEEAKAAEAAAYKRKRRREISDTETVERLLRRPGVDIRDGDEAARSAYGLKALNFEERRGLVGFDSLSDKRVSQYDLNEIKYQDMKRGDRTDYGMVGQLHALNKGMAATAGQDPGVKAQIEQAKKDRAALEPLWSVQPGSDEFNRAGQLYGREAELVLPIWRKLLSHEFDDKPEISLYRDKAKSLLSAIDTGESLSSDNTALLSELVKADKDGMFLSGVKSPVMNKVTNDALAKAKSLQQSEQIQDIMFKLGTDPKTAARLTKVIESQNKKSAAEEVDAKNKKDLSKFTLDSLLRLASPGVQLMRDIFGKANGGSIPFFQSGGAITQSGPIYAHKGEFVMPKGFADGGMVDSDVANAALKEGTIKLEDNGLSDKIADKIKEAIESSFVKIDEDAVVKVDVTDVSIPVNVGDAVVKVDTTDAMVGVDTGQIAKIEVDATQASSAIADAISQALDAATVDVNVTGSTGAVGADGLDEIRRTQQSLDDRILAVNDSTETKIEIVRGEIATTIQTEISQRVDAALTRVQQDINEHRNNISTFNSQIKRLEHQTDHRLREVDRKANEGWTLGNRPPTYSV